MARGTGSVVRRRQLGRLLRAMREEAHYTLEAAAPKLEWSTSKLSRIELGRQPVDIHGAKSMLDLYDVGGDRWDSTLDLVRASRERGWWHAYGLDDLGYVPLEAEANRVCEFTLTYIPGLLQTEDYARALFSASLTSGHNAELEKEVAVRMIRQERLTASENPLELVAIIDESVLTRPVGGPTVLRTQLAHLLAAAARDTVTFQVLPVSVGAHPGMSGAFAILSFEHLGEPDIAYVEHPMGAVHLEKDADVARARLVFDRLRSDALSPADSVALVRWLVEQA